MQPENFNILIERDGDHFVGYCPELSLTTGREPTAEKARSRLIEGIALAFAVPDAEEVGDLRLERRRQVRAQDEQELDESAGEPKKLPRIM